MLQFITENKETIITIMGFILYIVANYIKTKYSENKDVAKYIKMVQGGYSEAEALANSPLFKEHKKIKKLLKD